MKIKTFKTYLTEMPLPIDMDSNALEPKAGKYTKASAEKALSQHGFIAGKGSSRIAFRIAVEKEQFKNGHKGLPETDDNKINTVIKLALNGKGISQNEEEINTFNSYGHMGFLLPIIDSSNEHKINVILNNNPNSTYDDAEAARNSYSNWIQMPYVRQIKSPKEFNKYFVKYFGEIIVLAEQAGESLHEDYDFEALRYFFDSGAYQKIKWGKISKKLMSKEQEEHIHDLYELYEAGLAMGDLTRTANWGIYKENPVILDYGFNSNTRGLYSGAQEATAYVDKKGNINLDTKKIPPRRNW